MKKVIVCLCCLFVFVSVCVPASATVVSTSQANEQVINVPGTNFFNTLFRNIGNIFTEIFGGTPRVSSIKISDGPKVTLLPSNAKATYDIYYFDNAVKGKQNVSGHTSAEGVGGYVVVVTSDGFVSVATHCRYANSPSVPVNTYRVKFNANSDVDVNNLPADLTVESGYKLILNQNMIPSAHGYEFTGWRVQTGSLSYFYKAEDFTANPVSISITANHTFYANWKERDCLITFDNNGGTGGPESQIVSLSKPLTSNVPVGNNCICVGWSESSDATVADYLPGVAYAFDTDTTLYAVYEALQFDYEIFQDTSGKDYISIYNLKTKYRNYSGVLTIPTEINNIPVKVISISRSDVLNIDLTPNYSSGFCNTQISGLVIPDGIEKIHISAFSYCNNLSSVYLGKNVKSVSAFNSCKNLENLAVSPENNTLYSDGNCVIDTYSKTVLVGCKNSIIPDGVKGLTSGCFEGKGLVSLYVPASVIDIKAEFANANPELCSIVVASENPKYHSVNNCLIETDTKVLVHGCKNSTIPVDGSVTGIGRQAFAQCSDMTSINIPDTITLIGHNAFGDCTGLTGITIPGSVSRIAWYAFSGCFNLKNIIIESGVTSIGYYAFEGCSGVESIIIPDSVTEIEEDAFLRTGAVIYYTGTATGAPWGAKSVVS